MWTNDIQTATMKLSHLQRLSSRVGGRNFGRSIHRHNMIIASSKDSFTPRSSFSSEVTVEEKNTTPYDLYFWGTGSHGRIPSSAPTNTNKVFYTPQLVDVKEVFGVGK